MTDMAVTAETTDATLALLSDALWPSIEADPDHATAAVGHIGMAFRALLRGGQSPAQAVRTIGTMALFMSGLDYDEVDGTRVHPRPP